MARRVNKVKTGLSTPILYAGVEEALFALNLGLAVFMALSLRQYWYPVVALLLHFILRGVSKRESIAGKIYLRYSRQADVYSPWPALSQKRGFRPDGFGRNERLM